MLRLCLVLVGLFVRSEGASSFDDVDDQTLHRPPPDLRDSGLAFPKLVRVTPAHGARVEGSGGDEHTQESDEDHGRIFIILPPDLCVGARVGEGGGWEGVVVVVDGMKNLSRRQGRKTGKKKSFCSSISRSKLYPPKLLSLQAWFVYPY